MRVLRWLLLVAASALAFYSMIAATVAIHYLVEQYACPAVDFNRGICSNRALGVALEMIKHGGVALTVLAVACLAIIVAPSHKRWVLWITLGLQILLAAYWSYAGSALTLLVAALTGGVLAASVIPRLLSRTPLGHLTKPIQE